ncbi:MAG TPA: Gfo/Idh/MocA family oxidoreductase [Planctomycetota bacterium]|jgi:predicted dehydrogenase
MATTRRSFLKSILAAGSAPMFIPATALGAEGRPAASSRLTVGAIGMGGRGTGDMQTFLGFPECQVVTICDVRKEHSDRAKDIIDKKYGNTDCKAVVDFREITSRPDIDIAMIGTPDHWHAIIALEAMRAGKDVFCEKPETLTVREGRVMVETARRYGSVFSGGSQRVWEDYNWFHRVVKAGGIGEVKEAWIDCWGPSDECYLPPEPVPPGLDWDMWLGPAPWAPFNKGRLNFRPWRDYSGGGMTDWGAHNFGGALFTCGLQNTGPVEVIPPDGKDYPQLTYKFANGIVFHHKGGWTGNICFRGTDGEIPERGFGKRRHHPGGPNIYIPNYKGKGGLVGDFLHCVKTRERPFRDIEVAHRTVTVCHLGNIAYRLGRPFKFDPVKEEIVGDPEANKWLDRPKRGPWHL